MKLHGLFGRPFMDLSGLIDTSGFAAMDREISLALATLDCDGTGATLKSMGVVAPWVMGDGRRDAREALRALSEGELADFLSLGDGEVSEEALRDRDFGDETDHPFTRAQQRWLEEQTRLVVARDADSSSEMERQLARKRARDAIQQLALRLAKGRLARPAHGQAIDAKAIESLQQSFARHWQRRF
jgi:hypothetical protein